MIQVQGVQKRVNIRFNMILQNSVYCGPFFKKLDVYFLYLLYMTEALLYLIALLTKRIGRISKARKFFFGLLATSGDKYIHSVCCSFYGAVRDKICSVE